MVGQWLRAAASDPGRRVTARRYALGITVLQVAWVGMLWMPGLWGPGFVTLAALELAVPVWAERAEPTTWHPQHIAERYGLLTLIVLGESILSATVAVQSALASGEALPALLPLIVGGLLIVFSMWWVYFDRPVHDLLTSLAQGGRVGLRTLSRLCRRGCGRGGPRRQRRSGDPSREGQRGWRRRGGCDPCRGLSGLPLVSPRPARVSSDPIVRPDCRAARAADAVHRATPCS